MKVRNFGVQVEQIESGEMNEGESVISEWAKSDDSIVVLNPPVIKQEELEFKKVTKPKT